VIVIIDDKIQFIKRTMYRGNWPWDTSHITENI